MRNPIQRLALALLPILAACSDTELVGVHVRLAKDGSGTVTTRALQAATTPGSAEGKVRGVQWQVRADLMSSQGTFQKIEDLSFGDGEVRFVMSHDDSPHLRVLVQRRPDLTWVQALTPDQVTRRSLAKVHDPSGKTREIGDAIRIEVVLPDTAISSGVQPAGRGIEAQHERNKAYLILPVQSLLEKGDELVWDLSWK